MQVTVRLAGEIGQRLGSRRGLELHEGAVVADVLAALARDAGLEPRSLAGLAVVSNGSFLPRSRRIADGDELHVLTPVAGG